MTCLPLAHAGRLFLLIACLFAASSSAAQDTDSLDTTQPLSLAEAEQLALRADPLVPRYKALADAQQERAVADAQLPDPTLSLGIKDVPLQSLSLREDDFTMLTAQVSQEFPAGKTLHYRGEQARAEAEAEQERGSDQARKVLAAVRKAWLEVYYQGEARKLVRQAQRLFTEIVDVTQSQYGAGFVNQQDVLGAQLELGLLADRETTIDTELATAQAELGKWIGAHTLPRPLPEELPALQDLPSRARIEALLDSHPALLAEQALVDAGQGAVNIARQQYKPSFGVSVDYGYRAEFDDFVGAMVTLDLPIFPDKRQNKRLAASQQEVYAARYQRDDRKRELVHLLETEYARWTRLGEREVAYLDKLIPQAGQNAEAALTAYQSGVTDFPNLMRARITELETHLQALRLRVDRAQAQADLLYLAGDAS